ncbi:hypothetical protein Trydic_g23106 [Trypoxylus dichotomus]
MSRSLVCEPSDKEGDGSIGSEIRSALNTLNCEELELEVNDIEYDELNIRPGTDSANSNSTEASQRNKAECRYAVTDEGPFHVYLEGEGNLSNTHPAAISKLLLINHKEINQNVQAISFSGRNGIKVVLKSPLSANHLLESSFLREKEDYQEIHNLIQEVELLWVKGHIGIVGNESVDTFAKLGCTLRESLDHKLFPIDLDQFALKPIYSEFER